MNIKLFSFHPNRKEESDSKRSKFYANASDDINLSHTGEESHFRC